MLPFYHMEETYFLKNEAKLKQSAESWGLVENPITLLEPLNLAIYKISYSNGLSHQCSH